MNIKISTIINILVFILISFTMLVFQSVFISLDLLLCVVVYMGIKRNLREGILFTVFFAYIMSLNSGMVFFQCLVPYLLCYGLARYYGMNVFTGTARSVFLGTLLCTGTSSLLLLFWVRWADYYVLLRLVPKTILYILITSVLSLLLFRLFSFIDMKTERLEPEYIAEKHRRF